MSDTEHVRRLVADLNEAHAALARVRALLDRAPQHIDASAIRAALDGASCIREPEVRHATLDDGTTEFDEFVGREVDVHFEAMGQAAWWIGITDPRTGRLWHINCGAVNERAKGYAHCEEVTVSDGHRAAFDSTINELIGAYMGVDL